MLVIGLTLALVAWSELCYGRGTLSEWLKGTRSWKG